MADVGGVNQFQRASLAWPVLTEAATRRGTITYKEIGDQIGIHQRPVRYVLSVIQDHCLHEKLPPLTILVVNQQKHLPGAGFIAWDVDNLAEGYRLVYAHPWKELPNPFAFASSGETPDQLADQLITAPEDAAAVYTLIQNRGIAQDVFRRALLKAYRGRCAFCGLSIEAALQAAHIIPWGDAPIPDRISPTNGLLLCGTHHSLFDAHVLTVTATGQITCRIDYPTDQRWTAADRQFAISLHEKRIALPADPRLHPSAKALEHRASEADKTRRLGPGQ